MAWRIPEQVISSASQRVADFARSSEWNPGLYYGEEARLRCLALMDFLITNLVQELRPYDAEAMISFFIARHETVFHATEEYKNDLRLLWRRREEEGRRRETVDLLNEASTIKSRVGF